MGRIISGTAPFVKIFLPFAAGIVAAGAVSGGLFVIGVLVLAAFFLIVGWRGLIINLVIAVAGFGVVKCHDLRTTAPPTDTRIDLIIRTKDSPTLRGKWLRSSAKILCFTDSTGLWQNSGTEILLYSDSSKTISSGDIITCKTKYYTLPTPRIYTYNFTPIASEPSLASRLRRDINRKFDRIGLTARDQSTLSALTIGDKSSMEQSLQAGYSRAGVSHVLAVSGLHVGILYAILSGIVFGMGYWYRRKTLGNILIIITIWGYAILTGMSPSVCRAALMFTLWQSGEIFGMGRNSLNALGAAATIIVLFDPASLYSLSFQLSFLALVGIIYFYLPIYNSWRVNNLILRTLWSITVVGISAQICVMPLIAYYFGQLPMLGIVINPVVWLTVPVIMLLGLGYIVVPNDLFGQMLRFMLDLQNDAIEWTASLPFASIETTGVSLWQVAVMYIVIFGLIMWVEIRGHKT